MEFRSRERSWKICQYFVFLSPISLFLKVIPKKKISNMIHLGRLMFKTRSIQNILNIVYQQMCYIRSVCFKSIKSSFWAGLI